MTKMLSEITEIVAEILELEEEEVEAEAHLLNDLGATSVMILEIVVALEKKYDIEFDLDNSPSLVTPPSSMKFTFMRSRLFFDAGKCF